MRLSFVRLGLASTLLLGASAFADHGTLRQALDNIYRADSAIVSGNYRMAVNEIDSAAYRISSVSFGNFRLEDAVQYLRRSRSLVGYNNFRARDELNNAETIVEQELRLSGGGWGQPPILEPFPPHGGVFTVVEVGKGGTTNGDKNAACERARDRAASQAQQSCMNQGGRILNMTFSGCSCHKKEGSRDDYNCETTARLGCQR